jgi:hypothetical protein
MNKLPDSCATTDMNGKPIVIIKGRSGYLPMSAGFDIDEYNARDGIRADEEVIRIMTCASMFGWDIPAVTDYEAK